MNERTKGGLELLQAAILVGILGDVLLRAMPWGVNVTLFIGTLAAALIMLMRRHRTDLLSGNSLALCGAMVFFGAMFSWRSSEQLLVFDALAILSILAILLLPALKVPLSAGGVSHLAVGFVWAGVNSFAGPFLLLMDDIKWSTMPQKGWAKNLIAVIRGLLIAAPIVLVFGTLFVAADAVFQGIVEKTLNIQFDVIVSHLFLTGALAWTTAGFMRAAIMQSFPKDAEPAKPEESPSNVESVTAMKDEIHESADGKTDQKTEPKTKTSTLADYDNSLVPSFATFGTIEVSIVLGLINLLFLSFVIVQIPYLFGGFEFVQNTPDFKLAEYARRGFGELVAVAALVLPILLVGHWLIRKESPLAEKVFRAMAGIQIVLLFVIMASAAQRLFILTGNLGYGLTTTRFYPMVAMIWFAILFIIFAVTVLRGARNKFAWAAMWSAFIIIGALHFFNPDDYIARTNLRLMREGREFDASYNSRLSDDAIPALAENFDSLSIEDQKSAASGLTMRACAKIGDTDIRSWNWSRHRAKEVLTSNPSLLDSSIDCNNRSQGFDD